MLCYCSSSPVQSRSSPGECLLCSSSPVQSSPVIVVSARRDYKYFPPRGRRLVARPINLRQKHPGKSLVPHAIELELELIQSHMAQKQMLRGEVGARVRVIRACGQRRETHAIGLQGDLISSRSSPTRSLRAPLFLWPRWRRGHENRSNRDIERRAGVGSSRNAFTRAAYTRSARPELSCILFLRFSGCILCSWVEQ